MEERICTLCGHQSATQDDIKHLALYVIGSEGIWACLVFVLHEKCGEQLKKGTYIIKVCSDALF